MKKGILIQNIVFQIAQHCGFTNKSQTQLLKTTGSFASFLDVTTIVARHGFIAALFRQGLQLQLQHCINKSVT
jgi:hypothetical protein